MRLSSTRRRRCDAPAQRFKTLLRNHSLVGPTTGVTFPPTARVPTSDDGCAPAGRMNSLRQPNAGDTFVDGESPRNAQTGDGCGAPSPGSLASYDSSPVVHWPPSSPVALEKNNLLFKRISRRAATGFSCHSLLYTVPPLSIEHRQHHTVQTGGQSTYQGTYLPRHDYEATERPCTQAVAAQSCAETVPIGEEGTDVTEQTGSPGKCTHAVTTRLLADISDGEGVPAERRPSSHTNKLQSIPKHPAENPNPQTQPGTNEALCSPQQWNLPHDQRCNRPVLNVTSLRHFRDTGIIRRPMSVLAAPAGGEVNRSFPIGLPALQRSKASGDQSSLQIMSHSLSPVGTPASTESPMSPMRQVSADTLAGYGGMCPAGVNHAARPLSDSFAPRTGIGNGYSLWQRQGSPELSKGVLHPQKPSRAAEKGILQDSQCSYVDGKQFSSQDLDRSSIPLGNFRRLSSATTDHLPSVVANRGVVTPETEERSEEPDVTSAFLSTVEGEVGDSLICWQGKRLCDIREEVSTVTAKYACLFPGTIESQGKSRNGVTEEQNASVLRTERTGLDSSSQSVLPKSVESILPADAAATDGYHQVTLRLAGDSGQNEIVNTCYTTTFQYGLRRTKSVCRRAEEPSVPNSKKRCIARTRKPKGTNAQPVASNFEEAIQAMKSVLTLELCKLRRLIVHREISYGGLERLGGRPHNNALPGDLPLRCATAGEKSSMHASGERNVKPGQRLEAAAAVRKMLSSVARQNYAVVKVSHTEVMSSAAGLVVTGDLLWFRTCEEGSIDCNGCERAEGLEQLGNSTQVRLILPGCLQQQLRWTALHQGAKPAEHVKPNCLTCKSCHPPASEQRPVYLVLSKPRLLRFQRRRCNERGYGKVDTGCKEVSLLLHSGVAALDG